MKKLFTVIVSFVLFCPPLFAQTAGKIGARVAAVMQKQKSPLYTFVQKELQNYYGHAAFADPQRSEGWYRVDDFLTWLDKNATHLEEESLNLGNEPIALQQIYKKTKAWEFRPLQLAFWVYLGGRYIADVYQVQADFSRLFISYCDGGACAFGGTGIIFINPEHKDSVPAAINLGMHETTHLLTYLMHESSEPLSELATFYTQYNYGLPVKAADAANFGDAVRDIRRTYSFRPDFNLAYEYNYFVAGILLNSQITPQDILTFSKTDGFNADIPLWQTALELLAAEKDRFFVRTLPRRGWSVSVSQDTILNTLKDLGLPADAAEKWTKSPGKEFFLGIFQKNKLPFSVPYGAPKKISLFVKKQGEDFSFYSGYEPINKKQYLEKTFGPYAKDKRLKLFYDNLLKNLPPEVTASARQDWPVLTTETFFSSAAKEVRKNFADRYGDQITKAVLRTLQEAGAPPPPPLPKNYL